jgi:glycosyltransferase involved in cell wall biosynthesis
VDFLTNGYDEDDFPQQNEKKHDNYLITYIGTMSDIYPIDAFLEAVQLLIKKNSNVVFRFIGTISQSQKSKISSLPKDNYEIIPYVDHHSISTFLYEASVLLLLIPEHNSSKGIVPGKLFEYMAVGRPILVVGPEEGDGAKFVKLDNTGNFAKSNDVQKIYSTLDSWMSNRPIIIPNKAFSRRVITENLVRILNQL